MSEYLLIAENITYKHNKLSCINIYDSISVIAMPAEFIFDLVTICGPNWSVGEHKLAIKARVNNENEIPVGELNVNISNENSVYNAIANNLRVVLDANVKEITFIVYDNEKEVLSRTFPVAAMFIHKKAEESTN